MHANAELAADALRAGASGFMVKHGAGKELIAAIHTVVRGERYVTPPLASEVLAALANGPRVENDPLTRRQREVISLIAEGRTRRGVAAPLGLPPGREKTKKFGVVVSFGLQPPADLVRYALERGLAGTTPPAS